MNCDPKSSFPPVVYMRPEYRWSLKYILDRSEYLEVRLDNGKQKLRLLMDEYLSYKRRFAKDIIFDFAFLKNCAYSNV